LPAWAIVLIVVAVVTLVGVVGMVMFVLMTPHSGPLTVPGTFTIPQRITDDFESVSRRQLRPGRRRTTV